MDARRLGSFGRATLLVFLVVAGALSAGPRQALADPLVRVRVTVVHAKKSPPFLHDRIKPLWDTLRKTFGDRFAYYDLVSSAEREVAKQGRIEVPMPDGGTFAVVYRGVTEDGRFLKMTIVHGDLTSRVRIHDQGLLFQAGKRWQGGVLIVGVQASTVSP